MNTIFLIFTFLIFLLIAKKDFLLALFFIILLVFSLYAKKAIKNSRIKQFTTKIEQMKEDEKKGIEIKPIININNECWEIIELLPNVNRLTAKKIANRAREKNFKSFEELALFANFDSFTFEKIKNYIFL